MILGLTGAIGCGKSTACAFFHGKGWLLFDADRACHELYGDPDSPFARALRREWGESCFSPEGLIDRKALAARVFDSEKELAKLTSLLYPALFERMGKEIDSARKEEKNMLCEVPLLFECGCEKYFDLTASVWSTAALRHERLRKYRNFTPEEIARREAKQWSAERKLEAADIAFINNGGPDFLCRQIDRFIKEYVQK